jgi:hypothetical protein
MRSRALPGILGFLITSHPAASPSSRSRFSTNTSRSGLPCSLISANVRQCLLPKNSPKSLKGNSASELNYWNRWHSLGTNPCFRRERALLASARPFLHAGFATAALLLFAAAGWRAETASATNGTRRPIFLIEVASKDRSCFHRASTARRPWKQLADTLDKTVVLTMS